MCGIAGVVAHTDKSEPTIVDSVRTMCAAITHRGPDDDGFFVRRQVGLGMRRLSIVDLAGGRQPIFNEAGTVCVVFNGEIYNYQDLARRLESLGHRFTTHSDTEVIVHAYEQWGFDSPKYLNGMFAFAIWDEVRHILFIARDRFGKKPLYYYASGDTFVFGSELKALLESPAVPRTLNPVAVWEYLILGYVSAPQTLLKDVLKLPAGHSLTVDGNSLQIRQYWELKIGHTRPRTAGECMAELREMLTEVVRCRLIGDVPIGAFLSGGLDSSVVVAILAQHATGEVETFSAGFDDVRLDELSYARQVAQRLHTRHNEVVIRSCTPDTVRRIAWHCDDLIADPATVPTLALAELAGQRVKVVLTGEGGDEAFGGYSYYKQASRASSLDAIRRPLRRLFLPAAARLANRVRGRERFHRRTIWRWELPAYAELLPAQAVFTSGEAERIMRPSGWSEADASAVCARLNELYDEPAHGTHLERLLYLDLKLWLQDDLLTKVDRMTMAHSVEARAPYLDYRLVEFMATVPPHLKVHGQEAKRLLREAAQGLVPTAIGARPKHGFDVPLARWFATDLEGFTRDQLGDGVIGGCRVLDSELITRELLPLAVGGDFGAARQLWALLLLKVWSDRFGVTVG